MEIKTVKIDELKVFEGNPKKHPEEQINKIVRSFSEYGWTNPILATKDNMIVAGHARVEAAKKAGIREVPVIYLPFEGKKALAYAIADNKLAEREWDFGKMADLLTELDDGQFNLELTGFDIEEVEKIMNWTPAQFRPGAGYAKVDPEKIKDLTLSDTEKDKFHNYDTFLVQYSGGRDSTVALWWAKKNFPERRIVAVYSDPGVEFPGMGAAVEDVTQFLGVELEAVKPKTEWWIWIKANGWPSMIYRPCQAVFVFTPISEVIRKFNSKKTLLVDGSRAKQVIRGSKKGKDTKLPSLQYSKETKDFKAYHPTYALSDKDVWNIVQSEKIPIWRGYEMGFVRSACWCCPFQCGVQAYMLQKHYPGLADEIRYWEKRLGSGFCVRGKKVDKFDDKLRMGRKKLKVDDFDAIRY